MNQFSVHADRVYKCSEKASAAVGSQVAASWRCCMTLYGPKRRGRLCVSPRVSSDRRESDPDASEAILLILSQSGNPHGELKPVFFSGPFPVRESCSCRPIGPPQRQCGNALP